MHTTKKPLMYTDAQGERLRTWNPHPGCNFNCHYCPGKQTYARFSKCTKCKAFIPHFHPERLNDKFKAGDTIFVESLGDPNFIPPEALQLIFDHIAGFPKTTFMIQSKDPMCFTNSSRNGNEPAFYIPDNAWLGTTIETDNKLITRCYSLAPPPIDRYQQLHRCKELYPDLHFYLTIEPIMTCSIATMLDLTLSLDPDMVYIGRDNHHHHLPEPSEYELNLLVAKLEEQLSPEKVRTKTLGPAWWEKYQ